MRWLHLLTGPAVLYPFLGVVSLAVVWVTTLNLSQVERDAARSVARTAAAERLDTYEAQAVRVLREIDQTLKTVQYAYDVTADAEAALADLQGADLLPPDLVYTVRIVTVDGGGDDDVAGTAARSPGDRTDRFHHADTLVVSPPIVSTPPGSGDWRLRFSRGLIASDGTLTGTAVVEVDAAFFVSGYERSELGERGVLGLLGTDGYFRARRTGDHVTAGGRADYPALVAGNEASGTGVVLETNEWDGLRRYTSARRLYEFPLAVVVGLAEDERLAAAEAQVRTYVERAVGGSFVVILLIGALGRTNWKLARLRRREAEERAEHAERVEQLAYHDALTGLPNRSMLNRILERGISVARRYERRLGMMFLDLDGFKEINDTLGHEAGDELLIEVAARLRSTLRESDTVARMGGDEFIVVATELADENHAGMIARKILDVLREPFDMHGRTFHVTGSVGVAVYPADGGDEQELMKHADIAMYQVKEAGKNDFRFYSEEMSRGSREHLALTSDLRRAVIDEKFVLHYQARRDLGSGRITGMEALIRWQHPELGTVAPDEFLPLAEETGLILPIGRWVLTTACRQNIAWQEKGMPRLAVAVNLSARQFFDDDLVDDVESALRATGMDAELLELEIGEGVLARDFDRSVETLGALRELGVRITVDNFGTGYSALALLKRIPPDSIKVDRTFVRDSGGDQTERAVADAIFAMGRTLGPHLVAQGVETAEQLEYLRRRACDEVQGFYFHRPGPAEEIVELFGVRGSRR